jgi:serine/threonine protein kinase/tetratricopeptide (TPR) repeat protein
MREIPEPNLNEHADLTRTHHPSELAGGTIGPYRLLQLLGEGGMGEVWLAEQTRPLRRQVALKIVKLGMDTAQVVARFEAERQALAVMDHPAIAKVFDAGATAEGRPYFAMEYVRGEFLTTYCDRQRLNTQQRLELFLHICEGVQHAHQKGIIHRDLKPSNILVTLQDDHPSPKIIDFGVAKAMSQPLTEHTLYTCLGGFVGTPDYMSPEQAEMGGVDIDTRTDVYALGVVLYELLTGTLPFDRQGSKDKSFDDIRRTIREVDPPRPSTRITQLGRASAEAAANRRLEPTRLAGLLRGDLDWITMKTLDKDRARRYQSVSDLAADLRRHLEHQPVLAGPPSTVYRVRKFVRRHRLGVAAATTVVLLLIAFAAIMAVQARRIARERDRANWEAATAKQVSEFLVGLFKVSDPSEAKGNALTAREILESGAANIERDLAGQPEVQARIMATMGIVFTSLGLYNRAERLLKQAVTTDRRVLGDDHPATLTAVNALANAYWFQEKYGQAEPLYHEVVERRHRVLGEEHPDTLRANDDLASLYIAQKRFDEAERLDKKTLEIQRRVLGQDHRDTRLSLNLLQGMYYVQGRYSDAEPISRQAFEVSRRVDGEDHPDTLTDMHNLATVYDKLGRYDEAETLYLKTIQGKRRVLGQAHPRTVVSIKRLAQMYQRQRRFAESEAQLRAAFDMLQSTPDADVPSTKAVVAELENLYEAWGKPREAIEWRAKLPK